MRRVAIPVESPKYSRASGLFSRLIIRAAALGLAALVSSPSHAQAVDPGLVKQYLDQKGAGPGTPAASQLDQARQRAKQSADQRAARPARQIAAGSSRVEQDYQKRTGSDIKQFGYNIFGAGQDTSEIVTGRIPDRYVMGVGDELVVSFQGQTTSTVTTTIDREGRVVLPNLRPINAAGRSFGDFRRELESAAKSSLIGTEVYVSLGSVRMISVFMLGEVGQPGLYNLTSLTSALEALSAAGGIKKTGSLRQVRIERQGASIAVDLYAILDGSGSVASTLMDGDRIVVPPIGRTVAVIGDVLRPAIYELPKSANSLTIDRLLTMAGGTLRPRGYAFVLNRMDETGRQIFTTVSDRNAPIEDGDVVNASLRQNGQAGTVTLMGAVGAPGIRSIGEAPTMSRLLGDAHNMGDTPYLLFGAIQRVDPATRAKILQPFSPERIMAGAEDIDLKNDDKVIIFDQRDIAFLSSDETRLVVTTGQSISKCEPIRELARIVSDSQSGRFSTAVRAVLVQTDKTAGELTQRAAEDVAAGPTRDAGDISEQEVGRHEESGKYNVICPDIYTRVDHLLPFTLEYIVSVNGALRTPGVFPVAGETPLSVLAASAGGLAYNADLSRIEIMNFSVSKSDSSVLARRYVDATGANLAGIYVGPGSSVRVNLLFSDQEQGGILLTGEVRWPGIYSIRRGEKLSELIDRAGGLTDQSYAYGTVFTRERVRVAQQEGMQRVSRDLDSALASASLSKRDLDPGVLTAAQTLSEKIAKADVVGRMVIEADPDILKAKPTMDTVLEPSDRIYVPKRPNYVLVIGDVLNPSALQFMPGKNVKDYLRESGGVQSTGDKGRVFIVYPNGEAKPIKVAGSNMPIPPGSSIVVPKDATPFDSMMFIKDMTQILSQLAISAASIAVITR